MSAKPVLLLTPLREKGHNFKDATSPGSWQAITGTLGELGKALDVDEESKVDVVRSTPDPWSQARSFSEAVLNPSTLLSHMVDQWRGLIALFALSAEYENAYKLVLIPVPLRNSQSRFAQVMTQLLPRTELAAPLGEVSHGWDRPVIVRLFELDHEHRRITPGIDVGLLNPASLVAAGRDSDRVCVNAIPWMSNGLTDPTRLSGHEGLSPTKLHMLAHFLGRLDNDLAKMCADKGSSDQQVLLRNLREQVQLFKKDCLDPRRCPNIGRQSPEMEPGEMWADDMPPIYQLLARPITAKTPQPGTSDCIIRLRDDLGDQAPYKGLVLMDLALASSELPASHITFWGRRTLQEATSGPESERRALRETIAKAGYLVVTPDDFFTQVMVKLDDEEQPGRIDAHTEGLHNCLLPLSPLVLLVRKSTELASAVTINRDGKVSLGVMVSGRSHALSRRYVDKPKTGEGRLLAEVDWGLGDFAVWPNFRSEVWNHYFARIDYSTNSLNRLRGRFALSGRMLADFLRDAQAPERRAESMAPWVDSSALDNRGDAAVLDRIPEFKSRKFSSALYKRFRASASGGRASEIQISKAPYEAAFFSVSVDPEQPPYPAGLSVLKIEEKINPNDRVGVAAIDFGTTNTVACLNSTDPLRIDSRIVHPVKSAREKTAALLSNELTQKFRDFLPSDGRTLPTPTVIIGRPLDTIGRELLDADSELNDALLIRHLMYFQPDFADDGTISAIPIEEWSALLSNIKYNLKWSSAPEMRDAARRYLRQLMLMIACEWTAGGGNPVNLRWHFSRPKDMGDDQDFVGQLQHALSGVVPIPAPDAIGKIEYEGEAAAAYILDEKTKPQGTRGAINIILDIGGGTTDIAIWNNDKKQLLSASIRLAGGDFFTDHIMRNPEILDEFGLKAWSNVIQRLNQESDADLKANIHYIGELLFSGKTLDQAMEREWSRVSGTATVRCLKETAYVFMGGLAWFVGRMLRNLIRDGQLPRAALADIAVALCGRGSGLFVRLHGSDPRAQTEISRLLVLIAAAAGEARPNFPQVQVSRFPKIEVAAGMIIMEKERDKKSDRSSTASNGDAGIVFGGALEGGQSQVLPLSADQAYSDLPLEMGIEELDPFLNAFAMVSGFSIVINDNQRAKLINGVADIDREDERDGRPHQSEFAAVLKALVGLIRLREQDSLRPKTVWK